MKAVVIILGIAILVLLGIVVVTIIHRLGNPDDKDSAPVSATKPTTEVQESAQAIPQRPFVAWQQSLGLAEGETIVSTSTGNGIVTVLVGRQGVTRAIVLDARSGRKIGDINP